MKAVHYDPVEKELTFLPFIEEGSAIPKLVEGTHPLFLFSLTLLFSPGDFRLAGFRIGYADELIWRHHEERPGEPITGNGLFSYMEDALRRSADPGLDAERDEMLLPIKTLIRDILLIIPKSVLAPLLAH